jgi:hypothetical protein
MHGPGYLALSTVGLLRDAALGGAHARALVPRVAALVRERWGYVEGVREPEGLPVALGVALAVYLQFANRLTTPFFQTQIITL